MAERCFMSQPCSTSGRVPRDFCTPCWNAWSRARLQERRAAAGLKPSAGATQREHIEALEAELAELRAEKERRQVELDTMKRDVVLAVAGVRRTMRGLHLVERARLDDAERDQLSVSVARVQEVVTPLRAIAGGRSAPLVVLNDDGPDASTDADAAVASDLADFDDHELTA